MKTNRITELIAISLLITIFNLPTTSAADLPDEDVLRIEARVFYYNSHENQLKKDVLFAIVDGIRNVNKFTKDFLSGLYQEYNRKGDYQKTFEVNIAKYIDEQKEKVVQCLQKAPELDAAKTLSLFEGMCRRIFSLYEPFFESIDKLNKEFQGVPVSADFDKVTYAYFDCEIGSINLTKGKEAQQCRMLQDLSNLQSEIMLARALAPGIDKLDNFQLLLYITGVSQISLSDKIRVVNPSISGLYSAYGNKDLEQDAIVGLEQLAANHLKIADVVVPGKIKFTILPEKDGCYKIDVKQADGIRLTKDKIIGGAAKFALARKFIRMFTVEDDQMLKEITDTDEEIHSVLKKTGRTPAGYTQNELIMDYGTVTGKSSITQQMRLDVPALLKDKLERRGMTPPPVENAVEVLKIWVKELGIFPNTVTMEQSLEYTQRQAFQSPENATLLESLWMLRHVHDKYKNWQKAEQKAEFLDGMLPVLTQSITHLEDHNGKCGTGARGRTFLVELGMLNFFRDIHHNLEVDA